MEIKDIESGKKMRVMSLAFEMLTMLEGLEWRAFSTEWSSVCPICGESKYSGHDEGCDLGNLLQRVRGDQ